MAFAIILLSRLFRLAELVQRITHVERVRYGCLNGRGQLTTQSPARARIAPRGANLLSCR